MAFSGSAPTSAVINVTPLIDVLLVLLIIFMVIGPQLPHGLDSSIPTNSKSSIWPATVPLTLEVLARRPGQAPTYRVGSRMVELSELKPALAALLATRNASPQDRTLFVRADRTLDFGDVARAVGEARSAGAETVTLLGAETR